MKHLIANKVLELLNKTKRDSKKLVLRIAMDVVIYGMRI